MKTYVFGNIVSNESGPTYKIESKGVITIYVNVLFLKGK
jgi:hypothetical protein